jgi:hypothetical protein
LEQIHKRGVGGSEFEEAEELSYFMSWMAGFKAENMEVCEVFPGKWAITPLRRNFPKDERKD